MTNSEKRLTLVWTGLLAGLIAGLLTIAVPLFVHQLDAPFIGRLFGELFIGDIFGLVLCVYFWVFSRRRSVLGSIAFILASTAAYSLAWYTTAYSSMFIRFGRHMETDTIGGAPVLAFVLGGTVGAFVVLLAALLFFSSKRKALSRALMWSPVGGVLGALGWAAGPSLGSPIFDALGMWTAFSSERSDAAYTYSLYLVWQAGIGLTIGWLYSCEQLDRP